MTMRLIPGDKLAMFGEWPSIRSRILSADDADERRWGEYQDPVSTWFGAIVERSRDRTKNKGNPEQLLVVFSHLRQSALSDLRTDLRFAGGLTDGRANGSVECVAYPPAFLPVLALVEGRRVLRPRSD